MDSVEVLWNLYAENCAQGRHHEEQRSNVTNWFLVITGGSLVFLSKVQTGAQQLFPVWLIPIFLIGLGTFGAVFTAKQSERFDLHMARARVYRRELERKLKTVDPMDPVEIVLLKKEADAANDEDHPWLSKRQLRWFFIAIHSGVILIGLYLTILYLV